MHWDNYKHLFNKLQKKIVPKFIHMTKKIRNKGPCQSFSEIMMLAHCISFTPNLAISIKEGLLPKASFKPKVVRM
jgi:hypothetical protein